MNKTEFKTLIRECIVEVLRENLSQEDPSNPLYVEYHSQRTGENPFMMNGEKFEFVNAKYPNGKIDVGVYAFRGDMTYGYNAWRQQHNLQEITNVEEGERKCAWCGKHLGDDPKIQGTSHGICPACADKMKKDMPKKEEEPSVNEETSTGAVQGFLGKNWVDPDPKRKRMKSIAAKSVGGKVA